MAQLAEVGRSLLTAAMAAPYLGREEEHALALRWKNQSDEQACTSSREHICVS